MFSPEIENLVIKLLLTILNKEKEIEINRENLFLNKDFDIFKLYFFIDKQKKNNIDSLNILEFLNRNGIYPNKLDIDYLILFYDENNDNQLSFSEFSNIILSNNKFTNKIFCSFLNSNIISQEIEFLFSKLLEREIDLINNIKKIIYEIKGQYNFNLCHIFQLLIGSQNFITKDSLKYFLNKNYINVNEQDLIYIFKRFDFNNDNKVDFNEFHKLFCFEEQYSNNGKNLGLKNNNILKDNNKFIANENINQMNMRFNTNKENFNCNYNNINENNSKFPEKYNLNIYNNNNNSLISKSQNENPNEISRYLTLRKAPQKYFKNNNNNNMNNNQINIIPNNISQNQSINMMNDLKNNNNNINELYNIFPCNPNPQYCLKCNNFPCICNLLTLRKNELDFINYLKECINIEIKIEKAKIDLSLKSDFNVEDAFKIFEINNRKFISDADLIYGLNAFGIYPSKKDIQLIKKRLNVNKNKNILYSDFFDLIVPFQKDYRDMIEKRKPMKNFPQFNKENVFLESTKKYFCGLINLIISCENKIENLRSNLSNIRNEINNIFSLIDKNKIGNINDIDLNKYLKSRDIYINDIENSLLFIRYDKNKNGKIEDWELNEEFQMIK